MDVRPDVRQEATAGRAPRDHFGRRSPLIGRNRRRDSRRVAPHAVNHPRRERIQKVQAHEVEARRALDDARAMLWLTVGPEHRQVNPGETAVKSGAPDDVGHLQHTPVLEHGATVPYARHAPDPLHPRSAEVGGLLTDERRALGNHLRPRLPTHQRAHRQYPVEHHPHDEPSEKQPRREPVHLERNLAGVATRHPDGVLPGQLHRNLRSRVSGASDEHAARRRAERDSDNRSSAAERFPAASPQQAPAPGAFDSSPSPPPPASPRAPARPPR